jgi:hypothetical protein
LALTERLDPARTLFVVISEGGSTLETLCFFRFFYNWAAEAIGADKVSDHFVAVTNPDTILEGLAKKHNFRELFYDNFNLRGHSDCLSYFGVLPSALAGIDATGLIDSGVAMEKLCLPDVPPQKNPAAWLGTVLSQLERAGRDKATCFPSPPIAPVVEMINQLLTERTGKEGRGIMPVLGEPLGPPEVYGDDRLFIRLKLSGEEGDTKEDQVLDQAVADLKAAGHPVIQLPMRDRYDVAGQCVLWQWAAAIAAHLDGDPDPFKHPLVFEYKALERELLAEYTSKGALPEDEAPAFTADGMAVYGDVSGDTPVEALVEFLSQGEARSYIGLQAWIQPTAETNAALRALRSKLLDKYRLATTVGFGPGYAHTQGQIQKGDAGRGLFVQFTADDELDVPIPDVAGEPGSSVTFGKLKAIEYVAERQLLQKTKRRFIRFHLGTEPVRALHRLVESLP